MRCKKCGEELPDRARFCFVCGAPVEDVPVPHRLEEPLDPLAAGAVPLVPLAPPPRAYTLEPRAKRAAARGDLRSSLPVIRPQEPVVEKHVDEPDEPEVEKDLEPQEVSETPDAPEQEAAPETAEEERPEAEAEPAGEKDAEQESDSDAQEAEDPEGSDDAGDSDAESPEAEGDEAEGGAAEGDAAADDASEEGEPEQGDDSKAATVALAAERARAAAKVAASASSEFLQNARTNLASAGRQVRDGGRIVAEGFEGSRVHPAALAGGIAVLAIIVMVVLVGLGTSWIGPFAPPDEEPPVVQPPSDGSIPPLEADDEEPAEEEGEQEQVPEGAPEVRDAVADYSWEELAQISALIADASSDDEGIKLAEQYNLCGSGGSLDGSQAKDVELSDGTSVPFAIAGFRHDQRGDGSGVTGITFVARESLGTAQYNGSGDAISWEDSPLRSWLNDTVLGELPEDLSGSVVAASKTTNVPGGGQCETSDSLWLVSFSELCGTSSGGGMSLEGDQYRLFADQGITGSASSALQLADDYWWLRGASSDPRWQLTVTPDGNPHYARNPSYEFDVIAGFCL